MAKTLTDFFRNVMEDEALRAEYEKLGQSLDEDAGVEEKYEAAVVFAKQKGYDFTLEELRSECSNAAQGAAANGAYDCACIAGGGGPGDNNSRCATCGCVLGGIGMYWNAGARCGCPMVGGGVS